MKRLLCFLVFALAGTSFGAVPTVESPIAEVGTPVTVSISTSAWTKVPTSQTTGRIGLYLDLPAASNANVVGHLGNCTSTSIATTIRPIEVIKGEQSSYFPLREDVCLWLLSLHTAAENIHYQEVKKK